MYQRPFTCLAVKCCFFLFLLAFPALSRAQDGSHVEGIVTDGNGAPLPGVSVLLKNTLNGTATDNEGRYLLNIPDRTGTLVFSLVGFKTIETAVDGRETIEIVLQMDETALDEVVVVAYGQPTQESMVSSIRYE